MKKKDRCGIVTMWDATEQCKNRNYQESRVCNRNTGALRRLLMSLIFFFFLGKTAWVFSQESTHRCAFLCDRYCAKVRTIGLRYVLMH